MIIILFLKKEEKKIIEDFISENKEFTISVLNSLKQLFTGGMSPDQMVGIVGISDIVPSSLFPSVSMPHLSYQILESKTDESQFL